MNANLPLRACGLASPRTPSAAGCRETVVVLGGGGFVGGAIATSLAEAGYPVISAQRRAGPVRAGVRLQLCDATQGGPLGDLLQGAGCVVNAVGGDDRSMLAATQTVARAAEGCCRIVHISSMAVYGQATGYVPESAALLPAGRYGAAKIACEHALSGTGATILRPGIVYGPGSLQWVGRLGRLLRARRLGDLGKHGDGRCNLVHARDLGDAVVAAIRRRESHGQILNIGMTAPPRWNDFLVALGRSLGAVPVARIAGWRLALEAGAFAPPLHLAQRFGGVPDAIPPSLRRLFAQDIVLDCSRAERVLGMLHTDLAEGLAESATWFLEKYGFSGG